MLILLTDASFQHDILIQDQNNAGTLGILNTVCESIIYLSLVRQGFLNHASCLFLIPLKSQGKIMRQRCCSTDKHKSVSTDSFVSEKFIPYPSLSLSLSLKKKRKKEYSLTVNHIWRNSLPSGKSGYCSLQNHGGRLLEIRRVLAACLPKGKPGNHIRDRQGFRDESNSFAFASIGVSLTVLLSPGDHYCLLPFNKVKTGGLWCSLVFPGGEFGLCLPGCRVVSAACGDSSPGRASAPWPGTHGLLTSQVALGKSHSSRFLRNEGFGWHVTGFL